MCGRYAFTITAAELQAHFDLASVPEFAPRYNIAPSQNAPVVRLEGGRRLARMLRWGLVPRWAEDAKIGHRMINARAESVAVKPAFREAFRRRRCLVPATGFYEWKRMNGRKQPYFIHRKDGRPLTMAGLWEAWRDPTGEILESFTVITTQANAIVAPLHERMPAILPPEAYALWLDEHAADPASLQELLRAPAAEALEAYPVSPIVNNPANDTPACLKRQRA